MKKLTLVSLIAAPAITLSAGAMATDLSMLEGDIVPNSSKVSSEYITASDEFVPSITMQEVETDKSFSVSTGEMFVPKIMEQEDAIAEQPKVKRELDS